MTELIQIANRVMKISKRKIGGGLLILAGIVSLALPFLLNNPVQPATTPPPTGGNNHTGKSGGGGTAPPCTMSCSRSTDDQPPSTTARFTGSLSWPRTGVTYFHPDITIVLHATDDQNLTSTVLNDNGTTTMFSAHGRSSNASLALTTTGLHVLSYFSTDQAGNKEATHHTTVGLGKPDLSDLQNLITNSNINNQGIKDALLAKVKTAQSQLATGQSPNALNALSNQLNALDGKHGLDHATVLIMKTMIQTITP